MNSRKSGSELKSFWDSLETKTLTDGSKVPVMTSDQIVETRKRNDEINELSEKVDTISMAQNSWSNRPMKRQSTGSEFLRPKRKPLLIWFSNRRSLRIGTKTAS